MADGDKQKDPYAEYGGSVATQADPYAEYNAVEDKAAKPTEKPSAFRTALNYSGLPGLEQMLEGVGAGALQTVGGVSRAINKLPYVGETLAPSEGITALRKIATPENALQRVGAGAEQAAELVAAAPERGTGLLLRSLIGAGTGAGSIAGHEAGSETGQVRLPDVIAGGILGGVAPSIERGIEGAIGSKASRGFVNASVGANMRDVTYGNPAKALLDEGIGDISTGDLEKYKDAIRRGASPAQAAQAAGGRVAAVSGKIQELSPRLDTALRNSTNMVKVADAIDKPLNKAINEIIGNPSMTEPEKTAAFNQLAELHLSLRQGLGDEITPLQANQIKHALGERINWGGNTAIGDEVKPAYRAVYGSLKEAVNKAVPETAELNERLTNLLAAKKDLDRSMQFEEVGAGRGILGGSIGRNPVGRVEVMAGKGLPFVNAMAPYIGQGIKVTGLPAITQMGLPKVGPLEGER